MLMDSRVSGRGLCQRCLETPETEPWDLVHADSVLLYNQADVLFVLTLPSKKYIFYLDSSLPATFLRVCVSEESRGGLPVLSGFLIHWISSLALRFGVGFCWQEPVRGPWCEAGFVWFHPWEYVEEEEE